MERSRALVAALVGEAVAGGGGFVVIVGVVFAVGSTRTRLLLLLLLPWLLFVMVAFVKNELF